MSIPYQKTYDRAVIQELVVWFRERFDRLPQRIQLRPGMVIPDLKVMVRNYFDVVQMHYENPTYGAQVHHLFEVRDCLLAQGFEQSPARGEHSPSVSYSPRSRYPFITT